MFADYEKKDIFLITSFFIIGLPGAPGQKGEPGKYKFK